jgi:hypothetical protein
MQFSDTLKSELTNESIVETSGSWLLPDRVSGRLPRRRILLAYLLYQRM